METCQQIQSVPHQQQPIEPPLGLPPMDNQPPVDPYGDVPHGS